MATFQETIENYSSLSDDEKIYFFDKLKKTNDTILTEREKTVRQKEKDRLYETIGTLKEDSKKLLEEKESISNQLTEVKTQLEEKGTDMDAETKETLSTFEARVAAAETRAQEAENRANATNTRLLQQTAINEHKIPKHLHKFISGNDEESVAASAAQIMESYTAMKSEIEEEVKSKFAQETPPPETPVETPNPADNVAEDVAAPADPPAQDINNSQNGVDLEYNAPRQHDNIIVASPAIGNNSGSNEFSAQDIKNMDMATYSKNRHQIQQALKARQNRPLV